MSIYADREWLDRLHIVGVPGADPSIGVIEIAYLRKTVQVDSSGGHLEILMRVTAGRIAHETEQSSPARD